MRPSRVAVVPVKLERIPSEHRIGGRHRHTGRECRSPERTDERDRKSTRLNSSHLVIPYAVFCFKKKRITTTPPPILAQTHDRLSPLRSLVLGRPWTRARAPLPPFCLLIIDVRGHVDRPPHQHSL